MSDQPDAQVITGEAAEPIPWSDVRDRLDESRFAWLATTRPDGRPQSRPVLTVWLGDRCFTSTSPAARKARNLEADARCAVSVTVDGMDITVEGTATAVIDDATLAAVAAAYDRTYGWPVTVDVGTFDAPYGAPTAGPPPYRVYELHPEVAFAFGTCDELAPRSTRFRF